MTNMPWRANTQALRATPARPPMPPTIRARATIPRLSRSPIHLAFIPAACFPVGPGVEASPGAVRSTIRQSLLHPLEAYRPKAIRHCSSGPVPTDAGDCWADTASVLDRECHPAFFQHTCKRCAHVYDVDPQLGQLVGDPVAVRAGLARQEFDPSVLELL